MRSPPRPYLDMQARIIANTVLHPETDCWIWIGKRTKNGRGSINIRITRGQNKGKVRSKSVYRVAFEVFTGKRIKRHSVTRHTCDNPLCCNPEHLIANSTQKVNMRDMVKRGRNRNQHTKGKSK
jgi:HNH endonuclease